MTATAARLTASLIDRPPEQLAVGRGNAVFLRGRCVGTGEGIRSLSVAADGREHPVIAYGIPSEGAHGAGDEWWAILPVAPLESPRSVEVSLVAELSGGGRAEAELCRIELEPGRGGAGGSPEAIRRGSIAICMATHNPPLDLFKRQIASIREQTHTDWVCVVSDDRSEPERLEAIEGVLGDDPRMRLHPHPTRLGFYGNFERALGLAPPEAEYVALSDQDDRWFPDKLETLVSALRPESTLAFSDMRIVSRDGEVQLDSHWTHRRNNFTDLATLLIGNSITGAASLFRRELLEYVLPFPPRLGRSYHDHWLAVVALALGSVDYVDAPLHDYVQHPDAVVGYAAANAGRGASSNQALDALTRVRRVGGRIARPQARERYFDDYCRIALLARVLEARCGDQMDAGKLEAVRKVIACERSPRALAWLAGHSLRSLVGGNETMGVDRSALAGLIWSRFARRRAS